MQGSLEFLLDILDRDEPPCVAAEDWDSEHGPMLHVWQDMGLVDCKPVMNPVPNCPHCGDGEPYEIGGRLLCPSCLSNVDPRHLLLWRLDREAFLRWLAKQLRFQGGMMRVCDDLWQLGTWAGDGEVFECFYHRGVVLSDAARAKVTAYRNVIVFSGTTASPALAELPVRRVGLVDLLRMEDMLRVTDLGPLLRPRGTVRFDAHSGALWVSDAWLGEASVGSKEYFFLELLARNLDHFVAYADLKHGILRQSGSRDSMEEATFCHNLKNRIKKKWIPKIDLLLATTNKGDGYRLRGRLEL